MFKLFSILDENNRYLHTYPAQESPREAGVFISPVGAVEGEPTIPHLEGNYRVLNNGIWEYEAIVDADPEPEPELTIEQRRARMLVKRGQGRIALLDHHHLDTVENYVASPDCPPKVRIAYQDAVEWERLSETTAAMIALLELTPEQADDLFLYAAQVTY